MIGCSVEVNKLQDKMKCKDNIRFNVPNIIVIKLIGVVDVSVTCYRKLDERIE